MKAGFVYVVYTRFTNLFKVGYSTNPEERLSAFQQFYPDAYVVHLIRSNDCKRLESYFHVTYANKRVRGEWFNLNDNDIACIKTILTVSYKEEKPADELLQRSRLFLVDCGLNDIRLDIINLAILAYGQGSRKIPGHRSLRIGASKWCKAIDMLREYVSVKPGNSGGVYLKKEFRDLAHLKFHIENIREA